MARADRLLCHGRSSLSRMALAAQTKLRPNQLLSTFLLGVVGALVVGGCVSDEVEDAGPVGVYQRLLAEEGPQRRADTEGTDASKPLGLLEPTTEQPVKSFDEVEIVEDPNTGKKISKLSINQAIIRALANSPEIKVVSFDPSIAKQEITKAAADFDPTAFSEVNYEQEDNPQNSIFTPGESDVRLAEAGVRQKATTGAEWTFSYALTRSWDDLAGRTLSTRYEPLLAFQVRQPLWRDAGEKVNLAGVNVAKLNHTIALWGFRQRAEDVSTQVISAYWLLVQARQDLDIQRALLDQTAETLRKVQGRKGIDATAVQIKQAEASARSREAFLVRAQKRVIDAQDALLALMAAPEANLLTDTEILPVTTPYVEKEAFDQQKLLAKALRNNPRIQQARTSLEIAEINIEVAQNQYMPRLDLVASARGTGIGEDRFRAHDSLEHDGYISYGVGLVLEYPLGNRQRFAERSKRRLERRKAISTLHAISDQVAVEVKEKVRKAEASYTEIQVQKLASEAARIHLQALKDTAEVRQQLTPEFLLVTLQAQQDLAEARRAEIRAVTEFNIALAELAQACGTVLQLHRVEQALERVRTATAVPKAEQESPPHSSQRQSWPFQSGLGPGPIPAQQN